MYLKRGRRNKASIIVNITVTVSVSLRIKFFKKESKEEQKITVR